ncbi:MAG: hypothetical protein J5636_05310 [Clostridiales bacterium]|nr:hypothetical protein [Clostridiales bacterium]
MSSFITYSEEEKKLVREGGIDAIREILTGSDTDKKRSLLFCLEWFMDSYYGQPDIEPYKAELIELLETMIITGNPIEVKEDALLLLSDYCWGPFPILEKHFDEVEAQLKPNVRYAINMHREAQIENLLIDEIRRLWSEHRLAHPEVFNHVWVLFDRNTDTDGKPVLETVFLLENGEIRHDRLYPGKAPKKENKDGFFSEPEFRFNILLDEKKAVLTYTFSKALSGVLYYDILGEEDHYSLSAPKD